VHAGELSCTPAAFTSDEAVSGFVLPDQHGLDEALGPHRFRQLAQALFLENLSGLVSVPMNGLNWQKENQALLARALSRRAPGLRNEGRKPSAQDRLRQLLGDLTQATPY
jgi:hypothetical protein